MQMYVDTYNRVTTVAPFRRCFKKLRSSKTSEQKRDSNALCFKPSSDFALEMGGCHRKFTTNSAISQICCIIWLLIFSAVHIAYSVGLYLCLYKITRISAKSLNPLHPFAIMSILECVSRKNANFAENIVRYVTIP